MDERDTVRDRDGVTLGVRVSVSVGVLVPVAVWEEEAVCVSVSDGETV